MSWTGFRVVYSGQSIHSLVLAPRSEGNSKVESSEEESPASLSGVHLLAPQRYSRFINDQ